MSASRTNNSCAVLPGTCALVSGAIESLCGTRRWVQRRAFSTCQSSSTPASGLPSTRLPARLGLNGRDNVASGVRGWRLAVVLVHPSPRSHWAGLVWCLLRAVLGLRCRRNAHRSGCVFVLPLASLEHWVSGPPLCARRTLTGGRPSVSGTYC